MRDYNPDLRLIAVFRDPLERLFSHWTMLRGRWTTSPDWPEFITEFRPPTTPTALPDVPSLAFKQRSGVARGYYGDQLTRGLTIFPREQWLWLEFRSMLADFSGTLDQLTDFLGVDRYHRHPEPGRQMSGPDRVVGTPPSAADLTSLAELYDADLAQFGDVSGLDVDAWPTCRSSPAGSTPTTWPPSSPPASTPALVSRPSSGPPCHRPEGRRRARQGWLISGPGEEVRRDPVVHRDLGDVLAGARGVDDLATADVEGDVVDRGRVCRCRPRRPGRPAGAG